MHRKALAIRRELAAAPGADVKTRLDVALSLYATGSSLRGIGDTAAALAAFEEERDLAAALEAAAPTDTVRAYLGIGHNSIAIVLDAMGKPGEALDAYRKALAIYQTLPEDREYPVPGQGPTFGIQLQAGTYMTIGLGLSRAGKPAEAPGSNRKATDILEKLAKAYPANISVQSYLASGYNNSGIALMGTGKPEEAFTAWRKAIAIQQKIVDDHPAVSGYELLLAYAHNNMAVELKRTGRLAEALGEFREGLAIIQKLAAANPAVPDYQNDVAWGLNHLGRVYAGQKRFTEAFAAFERGLPILEKLVDANLTDPNHTINFGDGHSFRGWTHLHAGHPAEAAADLRRALELEEGEVRGNLRLLRAGAGRWPCWSGWRRTRNPA